MFAYLFSMLAVLLMGFVCLFVVHLTHRKEGSEPAALGIQRLELQSAALKSIKQGKFEDHSDEKIQWAIRDHEHRLTRELKSVLIPWGWSQAHIDTGNRSTGLSDAMLSLTDRLVKQKQLLDSSAPNARTRGSLRALLEDRYAPVNWSYPNEIEYRKVKAPLLRDPNAPHDQMDNFGGKQAELVRKKLHRVAKMNTDAVIAAKQKELRYVDLKDVKQPWGW